MESAHWGWQLSRVCVPALFIIMGWVVVSRDHNKRETRKEIRSYLDRTIVSVEKVCDMAFSYFTTECELEASSIGAKIDPLLMRLEKSLQHLNLKNEQDAPVTAAELRQAITGHNAYKTSPRRVLMCSDSALMQINITAHGLINDLEAAYRKQYQK